MLVSRTFAYWLGVFQPLAVTLPLHFHLAVEDSQLMAAILGFLKLFQQLRKHAAQKPQ
jgi:ABC-type uncharacterized transport system permease subunit